MYAVMGGYVDMATLGLSRNFSLAENLDIFSLQDRSQSGIIISLNPTHQQPLFVT